MKHSFKLRGDVFRVLAPSEWLSEEIPVSLRPTKFALNK